MLDLFNASLLSSGTDTNHVGLIHDVAYGIGIKYVEVALFTIPKHGYYDREEYRGNKVKSVVEARRVVKLLEGLVNDDSNMNMADSGEKKENLQKLALKVERSYEQVASDEKTKKSEIDWKEVETACTSWKEYVLDGTSNLCYLLEMLDCGGGGLGTVVEEKEGDVVTAVADNGKDEAKIDAKKAKQLGASKRVQDVNQSVREKEVVDATPVVDEPSFSQDNDDQMQIANKASSSSAVRDEAPYDELNGLKSNLHLDQTSFTQPPQKVDSCDSIITQKAEPAKINASADSTTLNQNNKTLPVLKDQTTRQNSHHSYTSDGFDRDELALALSLSKQELPVPTIPPECKQSNDQSKNISTQTQHYQQMFHSLVSQGKFHVRFLDTYQGRIQGSTNGCTVIAPLTCIQYFVTPECNSHSGRVWNAGIPDEHIKQVIDIHAPSVLESVRTKLDLPPDSFIIPSDVHDHFMDVGLLSPSSFVGVCGGNILDDEHLKQLKQSLLLSCDENERNRSCGRKIASPMFFHGHVVALHVIRDGGKVWIELIDSLPNPEAWVSPSRQDTSYRANVSSNCEVREPEDEWERQEQFIDDLPMNAVRVRCTDLEHFDTLLRHYALSKFSREERKFIESNQWEDNNSYFDPRVFQAFVWCEAE